MMNRIFTICCLCIYYGQALAQPHVYSVANAHSHNDYEQRTPFRAAYEAGFGSMEADIFLETDELYVAHDARELALHRSLERLYLQPLLAAVQKNNGYPYADTTRTLQMLIDIKSASQSTIDKLVKTLEKFPLLINSRAITWVITGNRPAPGQFSSYPAFILFDGDLGRGYNTEALQRIAMMSADFKHFSGWDGNDDIPEGDENRLKEVILAAHRLHKPVRFWNAPDSGNAWNELMLLQVDFINTDHIEALAAFLNEK